MAALFPRDKELTAIALSFKNPDQSLIADQVLPRVPVGTEAFEYMTYPTGTNFTIPQTLVGNKGDVNQVETSGTKVPGATNDYALEYPLSNKDIKQAPAKVDPRARATEVITNLLNLDREIRVAAKVFNPAAYANKSTLVGNTQWSDVSSNPLTALWAALDAPLMRPNILVVGRQVWSKLATHPAVVKAALGNDGTSGIVTPARLSELLGLADVLIGDARYNLNKPGKAPLLAYGWGKHALLAYRDKTVSTSGGLTFGCTFEYDSRVAGSVDDNRMGLRGGIVVKVGESVCEQIIANDCAYFFENAVA